MVFDKIEEAIVWLQRHLNPKSREGFSRLYHALEYLGNPHQQLHVIHITGTNGKGSVTAFLTQLCKSHHLKVGTFTSPHIMAFNERIALNGEPISDEALLQLTNEMVVLNDYMGQTTFGELMGFELYTVMACVYFARQQVDVALFEVGIGGLHDCTNVLNGEVSVITTIGLDHADKLGHTVTEVATQKAGIIKSQSAVVVGRIESDALSVIRQTSLQQQAVLWEYGTDFGYEVIEEMTYRGTKFVYHNYDFEIQMLGAYQVDNACVALKAFELWLTRHERTMKWELAQQALRQTKWMARLERVHEKPLVYIDGAHNHAGLEALRHSVQQLFQTSELTLLYSGLSTKDQTTQLQDLDKFAAKQLVLTQFDHVFAMSMESFEDIQRSCELQTPVQCDRNWKQWLSDYCQSDLSSSRVLLVTGSLYFVSQVRQWFMSRQYNS